MEEELLNIGSEDYENDSAIAQLVEYGRQKSIVTIDDILRFFPEAEQDVDQLEEAFSALLNAGIQYSEESSGDEGDDEDPPLGCPGEHQHDPVALLDAVFQADVDRLI